MSTHRLETLSIHAGNNGNDQQALQIPVYNTASYQFSSAQEAKERFGLEAFGNIYSRLTNPTVAALGERLAALEGGVGAICTSSGHAAQLTALFNLLNPGDNVVAVHNLYGGTVTQLSKSFKQFGWSAQFVPLNDFEAAEKAIDGETKALFIETIANPSGRVADVEAYADLAHKHGIPLIVDNTIPTAALVRPIAYGADIIVCSLTKFLTGNGSIVGGAVIDAGRFDYKGHPKFPLLSRPDSSYHGLVFAEAFGNICFFVRSIAVGLRDLGACLSPQSAFLALLSLETLSLRVERHVSNGYKVADFLKTHPAVEALSYGGFDESQKDLVAKYFPHGLPSVFGFKIKGGATAADAFINRLKLIRHVANLGDARTLAIHPAATTHSQLSDEAKEKASAAPGFVRLSIGLEHIDDILADIKQAL